MTEENHDAEDTGEETASATETHEEGEPDTFPRSYVAQLREEAAEHRTHAKDRDALAGRLHASLVAATGRLADPSDLPFNEEHLSDPDKLSEAIDALLEAKPHLASRKPIGDAGQGRRGDAPDTTDLAAILRSRA